MLVKVIITIFLYFATISSYGKPIIEIDLNSSIETQQIGYEFLQLLINSGHLIKDVELQNYIQTIGQYLVNVSLNRQQHFDFFLIDDNAINAFAGPYGYIGIHTGLINKTEHEAELAAVIAHEIAHVSKRHLKRYQERVSGQKYWIATAIIASILTKNSEVSSAILNSSIAAGIQQNIKFTRQHEQEADEVGINLLKKTRFNVRGMASFFKRLIDEKDAIEYLRTHPLSINRTTTSLQSILNQSTQTYQSSLDYQLIKARIYYTTFRQINFSDNAIVNRYIKAYDKFNKQQYQQAKIILQPILYYDNPMIAILAMRLYEHSQPKKAIKIGELSYKKYPNNQAVIYYLSSIYAKINNPEQGIKLLKQFIRTHHNILPILYEKLATLYLGHSQLDKYHINYAFALVKKGAYDQALVQLKNAKKHTRHENTYSLIIAYIKQVNRVKDLLEI